MEKSYRRLFGLESILQWACRQIRENGCPLFAALLVGSLSHFFAFTNKLVNFDEVGSLFNKGTTSTSGRWGLDVLSYLFPDISMPWIYGVLSIFLFAVSACILVRIFNIRSKLLQALLAGSILAFPSLTATVTFMYTLSSYGVAFLLAVISVWVLQKKPKYVWAAFLCLVFSLGIYQSYISVAASLLVLILIQQLLQGEVVKTVFWRGVRFVLFLVISVGGYYLITQLLFQIQGSGFNDYATGRLTFELSYIPTGIYEAYRAFYHFFATSSMRLVPTPVSSLFHIFCIAGICVLLLLWFLSWQNKKMELPRFLLLGCLLLLLPLAINCMFLFVSADPYYGAIHTLVLYSFTSVYVLAAIVADICDSPVFFQKKLMSIFTYGAQNLLGVALAVIIVINVYVANATYLNLHLRYENSYAFYTSLLADIKMMPEFDEDVRVAVVGSYQEPYFYWDEFSVTYGIYGASGFNPDTYTSWAFLYYYLGQQINLASSEEISAIQATEEYAQMPVYPYYGSMGMIQDVLVIKLS